MREGRTAFRVAAALLSLVLAIGAVAAQQSDLDICAERVRDDPDNLDSYLCYWYAARRGQWDGARRALEALLAIDPENQRARLYLAAVLSDRGHEGVERLYREAADGFGAMEEPRGEVYARLELCGMARRGGRKADARQELERAALVAEAAADQPELRARVWGVQASMEIEEENYGAGLALLRRAEEAAFPDGPVDLRSNILSQFGYVYWAQGLGERALAAYTREADFLREVGAGFLEVSARYNIVLVSALLLDNDRTGWSEHIPRVEQALELAVRTGNRKVEARTRLALGRAYETEPAIAETRRALEIARELNHRRLVREAQRLLASRLWVSEPRRAEEATEWMDAALEDARLTGDLGDVAHALFGRAKMREESAPREAWIESYRETIEAVERIRDLRPDGTVGARLFSEQVAPYYRFAGILLEGLTASPDPEHDLDLAFRTVERMRSRLLIDELDVAGAHPTHDADHPVVRRRAEVLEEIARLQKRLADPSLASGERAADLESLERLEMDEAALRAEMARIDPAFATLRAPRLPGLEEVRSRLGPDQVILSYQLAPSASRSRRLFFRQGGSWVIRITRQEASAFPLPDKKLLDDRVAIFLGLCRRRDGSEADTAARLFDDLLREPLRGVDPSVRELILVPDGSLHHLPFAALRPGPGERPVGVTYEITRVPSVRLWARWLDAEGERPPPRGLDSVLAFADPVLDGDTGDDPSRWSNPWSEGLRLGSLPRARSEARRLVRAAGGRGLVVSGTDASEGRLKATDLDPYRVVHLAAHAVVDYEHPERSAVVLASGGQSEDGFLQPREIVDLDLADRVVIVSACRSASGTVLSGEGVLGLSRAFFQAGARAVVGNLWTMRDDESEALVAELSHRLAEGRTLSGALTEARAKRFEAGAPAEAWAGLVVLGDGGVAPFAGGPEARFALWLSIVVGAALLAGVSLWAYRRYRSA
jgi:CHAT domain-containing protein